MLSDQQFDRTRRLALSLAGIQLVERHRDLLERRSRRLGIVDNEGLDSLLGAAEEGELQAKQKLLGLLTTRFTGFFRHPVHFEIAAEHARRAAEERGRARLWSAAAATGEEPYSLAMALIEIFQREDPLASILATDVEPEAIEVAQQGEYSESKLQALEPLQRERFFRKSSRKGRWIVVPSVRRLVEFRTLNLANIDWPIKGPFDVIFCRNVLMYLESCLRYGALEGMASFLAPDGLLILDPAEHLGKAANFFTPEAVGVYRRRNTLSSTTQCLSTPPGEPIRQEL